MTSLPATDIIYDPFETLNRTFAWAWETVCTAYDVTAELPDLQTLFDNADLSNPSQVAEMVVANMLMEMTERVSRFSAWYRMPARSYGLISVRSPVTNCIHWMLAPEAVHRWQEVFERLAHVIQRNAGQYRGGPVRGDPEEEMVWPSPASGAISSQASLCGGKVGR